MSDADRSRKVEGQVSNELPEPMFQTLDTRQPVEATRRSQVIAIWLGRASITTLRIALGGVFLLFGLLKFFDDVSPAERISVRTVESLTFDLLSGDVARISVAVFEVTIGVLMISGKFPVLGLALLGVAMVGILAPLVLFTDDLFAGKYHAPTLLGQYVIKDIVLLSAGMVITARVIAESESLEQNRR